MTPHAERALMSCKSDELLRNVNEEDTVIVINLHTVIMNTVTLISQKYEDYTEVFLKKETSKLPPE